MSLIIKNIEYFLPSNIEDADILKKDNPNWDVQKINDKTGVDKRHIATSIENTTTMAVKAVNKIKNFGKLKKKIEFVIFVTQTPEYQLPTSACVIQNILGIPTTAMCFDVNLGCSGFVYALAISNSFIKSKLYKSGLIVCSEKYSTYIDKDNRTCRPLFSDGAAAIIIEASKEPLMISFDLGTDGNGYDKLIVPKNNIKVKNNKTILKKNKIHMNGADVFTFTLNKVPETIRNNLKKNKLSINDINFFIFHQASKIVIENLSKKLNIPKEKMYNNYDKIGNTVSPTIPIALHEAQQKKLIKKNDLIMMIGFGVGYSWGSCILKWN